MTSGGRLAQRVALVTGGGGEIGGAICRRFAPEGAEVAIADLDPAKSEAGARATAGHRVPSVAHAVDKIRANTISPGFIPTERSSRRSGGKEGARAVAGPRHLLNRPGEPEEIAAGAVYLASDDAAFVTATDLLIDGGYIAFKGRIDADGRPAMI